MGEVFAGRYELADPIGRGGVGAVWRAWDHRRRRYVAAKVLQQSDAHTLLRFVREQALRIDHPHVLAPASWAADDDKVLFTMDLVARRLAGPSDRGLRPAAAALRVHPAGPAAGRADRGARGGRRAPRHQARQHPAGGHRHRPAASAAVRLRHLDAQGRAAADRDQLRGGHARLLRARAADGRRAGLPRRPVRGRPGRAVSAHGHQAGRRGADRALHRARHPGAPEGVPEPLWQVLAGLLQPDPQARFRTATGARKALAAAAELLPDATTEEEIVEVFDHIGPLPAGFGPDGPLRTKDAAAPRRPAPPRHGGHRAPSPCRTPAASSSRRRSRAARRRRPPHARTDAHADAGAGGRLPPGGRPRARRHAPRAMVRPARVARRHGTASRHRPGSPRHGTSRRHRVAGTGPRPRPPYEPRPPSTRSSATRPYTAGPLPVPGSPGGTPAVAGRSAPAPYSRPGPPPKVAIPVLIVALLCFAVGVWALIAA